MLAADGEMNNPLSEVEQRALARIASASNIDELEAVRVDVLGRKGALAQVSKEFGKMPPEQRAATGKLLNSVKEKVEKAIEDRRAGFDAAALAARLNAEWLDRTLPAPGPRAGSLHPVTQIQREIEDLFHSLGFAVLDGPEVETEYNNFDALNIPPDHPARDMQDTFWIENGYLLRTHTSAVQVRGMARLK